jgi:DNA-binding NtrC family response regulator
MTVPLMGLRVMLVEDEMLVSLMVEEVLVDVGCIMVGPFSRVDQALLAAQNEAVDIAVLDVNVAGVKVYPVAEALAARKIPFLFLTGYGREAVPKEHPDWAFCSKPFRADKLLTMLEEQVSRHSLARPN